MGFLEIIALIFVFFLFFNEGKTNVSSSIRNPKDNPPSSRNMVCPACNGDKQVLGACALCKGEGKIKTT